MLAIEQFGVVISAGATTARHWCFDGARLACLIQQLVGAVAVDHLCNNFILQVTHTNLLSHFPSQKVNPAHPVIIMN